MKKILFTLLSVFVAITMSAQVTADLTIKKGVDLEPNGLEDDEIWSLIDPIAVDQVFNYETPSVDAWFKMFYTDEYIYVLVDVTDDVHYPAWIAEDTKNEWMYDKVELYFDINDVLKDGKGPAYIDGFMAAGHYQMAPFLQEDLYGIAHEPKNIIYGTLNELVTMCYTLKPEDTGYVMEYRFPMYGFVNDKEEELDVEAFLSLPQGMGFDVLIVDNDNDGKGRQRAIWKNIGPTEPYTNMDNCGVVVFSEESLIKDNPDGIEKTEIATISVYPNPAKDQITINAEFDRAVFVNISGQEVKVVNGERNVNVSELSSGLYLLKVYENNTLKGISKVNKL